MKNKPKTSTVMLVIICIMVILYAVADFCLQFYAGVEVSPTLTTAWFAFWGAEVVSLAAIKTSKVKHQKDNKEKEQKEETKDK